MTPRSSDNVLPSSTSSPKDELPGGDVSSPDEQPRSLESALRSRSTLISFGIAAAIIFFLFRGMKIDFRESWAQMKRADLLLFLAALLCYYLSMLVRGYRWRGMLGQAGISEATGHRMPTLLGMFEIIVLSWFANSVLPAKLGDGYRGYLIKRRSGCSFSISFGTILAERLIDLVVLVGVLLVSGMVVFGIHAPGKTQQAFLWGGGVVAVGVIGVVLLWIFRDHVERFLPHRLVMHYQRVQAGLFAVLVNPWKPALLSVVIWILDGLRVFLIARSLATAIHFSESLMVSLISALVSIIPFTPAGLGFVETFMVTALIQIGVPVSTAAAIALLDRVVTYLSLIVVGIPLYFFILRREARADDAPVG